MLRELRRADGIRIRKLRVPLGVVAVVYEARPNVTADAAALCLKSANACILRGSRMAAHTNRVLIDVVRAALAEAGLPADAVQQSTPAATSCASSSPTRRPPTSSSPAAARS